MTPSMKKYAFVAACALTSLAATGCDSETNPPEPETDSVTLNVTRGGKPVTGMQVILQNDKNLAEVGSATLSASGAITSSEISVDDTVTATFVDAISATTVYMYTLRNLEVGSDLSIELPDLAPAIVGQLSYLDPVAYPGADTYTFGVVTRTGYTPVYKAAVVPGTPNLIDIPEHAVLDNGKVTFLAIAYMGGEEIAYSYIKAAPFALTGGTPTDVSISPWTAFSPSNTISTQINVTAADGAISSAYASVDQFSQGVFGSLFPFSNPANPTINPQIFKTHVIPGFADEYVTSTSIQDATGFSRNQVRRSATLAALTSWTPSSSQLKRMSDLQLDASATAGAPALTWTNAAAQTGADVVVSAVQWTAGSSGFAWFMLSPPEATTAGVAQFPELPAAYAGYAPTPGTIFDYKVALYANYSDHAGYAAMIEQENLRSLLLRPSVGDMDIVGLSQ